MKTFLAIFLGVAAGVKVQYAPKCCYKAPTCGSAPTAGQLNCPAVSNDGFGYGQISSRSKGQS